MSNKYPSPLTVVEHKSLIESLSPCEYVYLFDARVRSAITFDEAEKRFYVCACSTSGEWFIIDTFEDVYSVQPAFVACGNAVINTFQNGTINDDLGNIGFKRTF